MTLQDLGSGDILRDYQQFWGVEYHLTGPGRQKTQPQREKAAIRPSGINGLNPGEELPERVTGCRVQGEKRILDISSSPLWDRSRASR